jgi:tetratricopeptide (TPR) repeat protein
MLGGEFCGVGTETHQPPPRAGEDIVMRTHFMVIRALGISLLSSGLLRAGLYNAAEPIEGPVVAQDGVKALGFSQFEDVLSSLIGIGIQPPPGSKQADSLKRRQYLARRDELQAKARAGHITTEERVNLSAYLIRLRQYEEAVQLLEPVAAQERQNFMLFANLATAHQLAGRLDRALAYLEQTKDVWPTDWPGLTKEQLKWFRTAEKYHLELVKLRYRELARPPSGRSSAGENLDDLFHGDRGPVRFTGENGRYEAGKLAAAERAKLPANALAIVQQLVLWLPEDTRLYWLLGELYNANGDVEAAAKIFDECVGNVRRFSAPDLRAHRMVVQEAKPKIASSLLDLEADRAGTPTVNTPAGDSVPSWLPDIRQLVTVGALAGLAVIVLAYFQVREMRRRRKSV